MIKTTMKSSLYTFSVMEIFMIMLIISVDLLLRLKSEFLKIMDYLQLTIDFSNKTNSYSSITN